MRVKQSVMDAMADNYKAYLDIIDSFIIIEGISQEEYDDARKKVKKLIKYLREGKAEKVFSKKRYREALVNGDLSDCE